MSAITNTHIIISALGSKGDIHPLIAIAIELKKRGAKDVTFLVNDYYQDLIKTHGFKFISTGTKEVHMEFVQDNRIWNNRHDIVKIGWNGLISQSIENTYKAVEEAHQSVDPVLVIGLQSLFNGALMAAEALDIPNVHITLAPQLVAFHSRLSPPAPLKWYISKSLSPILKQKFINKIHSIHQKKVGKESHYKELNKMRSIWKLNPYENFSADTTFSKNSLQIGLFPNWFAQPATDWPKNLHLTGFPLFDGTEKTIPEEVEQFIETQGSPIVFTFGTGFYDTEKVFKIGLQACEQLNRPGLFVGNTSNSHYISTRRHLHIPYVDFETIFPKCLAVVHHGGIGTMAQAIRSGIPQIIRPQAFDQFDNADKIYNLGLGSFILKRKFSVKNLTKVLNEIIQSKAIKQNIHYYASLIKNQNPIQCACDHIETYLKTPKGLRTIHPATRTIIRHLENTQKTQKLNIPLLKTKDKTQANGNHEALAMLCQFYNKSISINTIYDLYPTTLTLSNMRAIFQQYVLNPRIIKCPAKDLTGLQLPCLIEWQSSRFVVLAGFDSENIHIRDPILEQQIYPIYEFAWYYNQIALEIINKKAKDELIMEKIFDLYE